MSYERSWRKAPMQASPAPGHKKNPSKGKKGRKNGGNPRSAGHKNSPRVGSPTTLMTSLEKTRMCKFVPTTSCPHGARCAFAHSVGELRKSPTEGLKLCRYFVQGGYCELGELCRFSHRPDDLASTLRMDVTALMPLAKSELEAMAAVSGRPPSPSEVADAIAVVAWSRPTRFLSDQAIDLPAKLKMLRRTATGRDAVAAGAKQQAGRSIVVNGRVSPLRDFLKETISLNMSQQEVRAPSPPSLMTNVRPPPGFAPRPMRQSLDEWKALERMLAKVSLEDCDDDLDELAA